ncbi:MAG: hypothetical protein ACW986_03765 [Promethearchaeota archaeon]|jgi:hypothetical protein
MITGIAKQTHGQSDTRKVFRNLRKILEVLEEFKNHYDKKLNFSKLTTLLDLSPSEGETIITLLLRFQDLFTHIFRNFQLKTRIENNQIFLVADLTRKRNYQVLTKSQIKLINDIIYTFKNVKRGQGYKLESNGCELLRNVKLLYMEHPYLFEKGENGFIYPSKVGLKLGENILTYTKSNKEIEKLTIENYIFVVVENE